MDEFFNAGYYDPKGDARSNESDELSGWYYIKAD